MWLFTGSFFSQYAAHFVNVQLLLIYILPHDFNSFWSHNAPFTLDGRTSPEILHRFPSIPFFPIPFARTITSQCVLLSTPAHCVARSPKNSKSQDIIELKIIHDEKFEWGSGWNLMCHLLDHNHLIGSRQRGVGTKKNGRGWAMTQRGVTPSNRYYTTFNVLKTPLHNSCLLRSTALQSTHSG